MRLSLLQSEYSASAPMTLPDRCCHKTLEAHAVRASLPSVHSHLHFPPSLSTAGLLNARCVTQTSGQQLLSPKVSQDSLIIVLVEVMRGIRMLLKPHSGRLCMRGRWFSHDFWPQSNSSSAYFDMLIRNASVLISQHTKWLSMDLLPHTRVLLVAIPPTTRDPRLSHYSPV